MYFNVNRLTIMDDMITDILNVYKNECKINVRFFREEGMGEEGIDAAGLTREALSACVTKILKESGIFSANYMLINKLTCKLMRFLSLQAIRDFFLF